MPKIRSVRTALVTTCLKKKQDKSLWEAVSASVDSLRTGQLWADTGCVRAVGGEKYHMELTEKYVQQGLQPIELKNSDCSDLAQELNNSRRSE